MRARTVYRIGHGLVTWSWVPIVVGGAVALATWSLVPWVLGMAASLVLIVASLALMPVFLRQVQRERDAAGRGTG